MTRTTVEIEERVIRAWEIAGQNLAIDVITEYQFQVGGRTHRCLAWLPHFGGTRGILVQLTTPPDYATDGDLAADAAREGYGLSFVDAKAYGDFDRDVFVEALRDWGFFGPESKRPTWLHPH